MNCKHVQELLPLYVGRDLEEKRAQLVTAHVQSCAECAAAADEYRQTRQLLQQFAPPPFSEGVYTGIRQRVLREIGQESPESIVATLPQLIASLFRPPVRWAVATALLLAVSVFAFYFIANRRPTLRDARQVADSRPTVDGTTRDEHASAPSQGSESAASSSPSSKENNGPRSVNTGASTGPKTGPDTTIAGPADHPYPSQRRKSPGAAADRTTSVAVNTPDTRSMTAAASRENNNLAEPDAFPTRDPATSEKTLRMEMQTKNPNIRIIWFSHQRTKQNFPGKSSKHIPEVRSYA